MKGHCFVSQTLPRHTGIGKLGDIQKPILGELKEVEKILLGEMRNDVPWMNKLLESSTLSKGKRMRPALLLLSGGQMGQLDERHFAMAAAIEMIHVATLLHDDVIDDAESRRHQPTVHNQHGQRVSILLGDFLFTHAFSLSSRSGSSEAISILARSSNRVCEGEMRQNLWQGSTDVSQSDYLEMISDKTGELVAAACHLGAFLSGANEHACAGFEKYGRDLGVAFQIIDDVLDIVGDQETVGKTLGTDVANLKLTLPLIHCRNSLPDDAQSDFLTFLTAKEYNQNQLLEWLQKTESLQFARDMARDRIKQANEFAVSLGEGVHAKALAQVAEFILLRTF